MYMSPEVDKIWSKHRNPVPYCNVWCQKTWV